MSTDLPEGFEQHTHEAIVHSHDHVHVTHNWSDQARTFMHLSSAHDHDHDHAELSHAHLPHQDFDAEHRGEAHDHDHGAPVRKQTSGGRAKKATAKKATATKATGEPGEPGE